MRKYTNEKEILEALERQAFILGKKLEQKDISIQEYSDALPHEITVVKHELERFAPTFFAERSLTMLDMSPEEYTKDALNIKRYVFPGDFERSVALIEGMGNKQETPVSYLQRIKLYGKETYEGIYSLSKKSLVNNELVSVYIPVRNFASSSNRLLRLLDESLFVKNNYWKFSLLTRREKEIITLLAVGFQNHEIADQLFISKSTVEQHRKNLKRKLGIRRFIDLIRFAQAFDLI
ncbi:hypothetical protein BKI52_27575 [marine bacterium AO1-C]|nr:hypothetical protein BKI52_27575 [marine bacterium AO1-C]